MDLKQEEISVLADELKRILQTVNSSEKVPAGIYPQPVFNFESSKFEIFNSYLRNNNNVEAAKIIAQLRIEEPDNLIYLMNEGYNFIKIGEPQKAHDNFLRIMKSKCPVDMVYPAISNYMMSCDYLNIPLVDRYNIQQFYPKPTTDKPIIVNNGKINIGYVLADAYSHPVGRVMLNIVKNHNKEKFNVTVFYAGNEFDNLTKEIMQNVDHFVWIGNIESKPTGMSSKEVYETIKELKIEVLIDMNGHTNGGYRLPLFCKRPCFLQGTMIGYPNSTLLDCFDFRMLSDYSYFYATSDYNFWTEPIFHNAYGYMPYAKSFDVDIKRNKDQNIFVLGYLGNISKLTKEDIWHHIGVLCRMRRERNTVVLYARLGTQYTSEKAQWILDQYCGMSQYVSIENWKNQPYMKLLERVDMLLNTSAWSNHALAIDALSSGIGIDSGNMQDEAQTVMSTLAHDLMRHWQRTTPIQWVQEYECIVTAQYNNKIKGLQK